MSKGKENPDTGTSRATRDGHKSVLQDALSALDKMQARLDAEKRKRHEPIAVVGMGCRFPGEADSPAAYWQLLRDGVDAVREVPATRFDLSECSMPDANTSGETSALFAGLIDDVDRFDASFFEISPREAESLDPQHRVLLEVSWETLEHAAIPPDKLRGSQTGVFVGITTSDYARMMIEGPAAGLDAYTATGGALNAAAGRLAYVLGLNGPCMAIDTACSSSLVAVHLACQSLRGGECDLALAGGVNMLLAPEPFVCFNRWGMMAPDGRCKAFDARANGFVRSEGCGLVALKRLSDAEAGGDRILALIRGSAVNQDGASSGLTVPNGLAQQALLKSALKNAEVDSSDVDYVEAHGTGTSLGDPIEMEALGAVLGPGRNADRPFRVGSVKTNLGHLESAAGIAGMIKTVLALQHEEIPPQQHFVEPSPQIGWDSIPVRVVTERTPWRSDGRPRIAGVSGFGFSGTNAHVVLSEAPVGGGTDPGQSDSQQLLCLSAKSPEALSELTRRYIAGIGVDSEPTLSDLCYTAWAGRTHFPYRQTVMARSVTELREKLTLALEEQEVAGVLFGAPNSGCDATLSPAGAEARSIDAVESDHPDREQLLEQAAQAYCSGLDQDFSALFSDRPSRRVELPTYPFQRQRFWIDTAQRVPRYRANADHHPLLGSPVELAAAQDLHVWQGSLDLESLPYLRDHCVQGRALVPATAYVEMAMAGAAMAHGLEALSLDEIEIIKPLFLEEGEIFSVQTTLSGTPESGIRFEIHTVAEGSSVAQRSWTLGARGVLRPLAKVDVEPLIIEEIQVRCSEEVDGPEFYRLLEERGNGWGPCFQGLDRLWRREGEALARIEAPAALQPDMGCYQFQPALADASGHALAATIPLAKSDTEMGGAFVGAGIDEIRFYGPPQGSTWWSHARLRTDRPTPTNILRGDVRVYDESGALVAETLGARLWYLDSKTTGGGAGESDRWLYQVNWEPADSLPDPTPTEAAGVWLIASDQSGTGAELAGLIRELGGEPVQVRPGESFKGLDNGHIEVRAGDAEDMTRMLQEVLASAGEAGIRGIVHLWSLDASGSANMTSDELEAAQDLGCISLLHLVHGILESGHETPPRIWLVTKAAVSTNDGAGLSVAQAPLWGFGRSLAAEHSELWGGMIDLDPGATTEAALLWRELFAEGSEDQVAFRQNRRLVRRMARFEAPRVVDDPFPVRADGAYLISGGLGGIGREVARWIVERGARHVILAGRTELPPRDSWDEIDDESLAVKVRAIEALEAAGAVVHLFSLDIADEEALRTALDAYRDSGGPAIRGVFHAAGAMQYQALSEHYADDMWAILRPKMIGAWLLHRLLDGEALDCFVLFSSSSSILSSPLMASYSAANTFLDALARQRRADGQPALAINWGTWGEVGMALSFQSSGTSLRGVGTIPTEKGLQVLERLMALEAVQVAVMPLDWDEWRRLYPAFMEAPFLQHIASELSIEGMMPVAATREAAPTNLPPLGEFLAESVSAVLRISGSGIDPDQRLSTLGFDSLMAVELKNRVESGLGVVIPIVELMEGPSITQLERLLAGKLEAGRASNVQPVAEEAEFEEGEL